jgi:hypothetical protein
LLKEILIEEKVVDGLSIGVSDIFGFYWRFIYRNLRGRSERAFCTIQIARKFSKDLSFSSQC